MNRAPKIERLPRRILPTSLCFLALLAGAFPASGETLQASPLSATVIDLPQPGEPLRVAVSWKGPLPQSIRAWLDFNGNNVLEAGEDLTGWRTLEAPMEVIEAHVPRSFEGTLARHRVKVEIQKQQAAGTQSGGCEWSGAFYFKDFVGNPILDTATAVTWNGSLYVSGNFIIAGDQLASRIARWDGSSWSAVTADPDFPGMDGGVSALTVFDDGNGEALYAAGGFSTAGGVAAQRIAKWDGSHWSSLAGSTGPLEGSIRSLIVWDDGDGEALYAAGGITGAGGIIGVAKWDGTAWLPLLGPGGQGINSGVNEMTAYFDGSSESLVVGGWFTQADGQTANHVAKWDGTEWSVFAGQGGIGTDMEAEAVQGFDDGSGPALFVGGRFTSAGGVPVNNVAKWNGTEWLPLFGPTGVNGVENTVYELQTFDDGSGEAP